VDVIVKQAEDVVTFTFDRKALLAQLPADPSQATPVEVLEEIVDLASKACFKLRTNNNLWANATMMPLEAALTKINRYTPPKYQG
jgi:hypothetical protein